MRVNTDGWMGGWVDDVGGWMDGRTDGWMDGRMDGHALGILCTLQCCHDFFILPFFFDPRRGHFDLYEHSMALHKLVNARLCLLQRSSSLHNLFRSLFLRTDVGGWTDGCTHGRMHGRMHGRTDARTDARTRMSIASTR